MKEIYQYKTFNTSIEFEKWQEKNEVHIKEIQQLQNEPDKIFLVYSEKNWKELREEYINNLIDFHNYTKEEAYNELNEIIKENDNDNILEDEENDDDTELVH